MVTAGCSASAQRVGAGDDLPAAAFPGRGVGRDRGQLLADRPGGQPQVGRAAVRPSEPGQAGQQAPFGVDGEGRLVGHAARLLDPDRRGGDRLVRAALRRQAHPGRRADQDRLAAGVDAERPRLERALHERVVQHADRQQRLAPAAPGRAELAEQADQVGLGDAELDVLPGRLLPPVQDRLGVVGEPVGPLPGRPHADLVDPAAEVGARADVRAHRHHPPRRLGRLPGQVEQRPAQCRLGGGHPAGVRPRSCGTAGGACPGDARAAQPPGGLRAQRAAALPRRAARCHGRPGSAPSCAASSPIWASRQQRGMVLRMPLDGQAVALDRVGQDHRRPAVVDRLERFVQRRQVMPAEVADGARQAASSRSAMSRASGLVAARQPAAQLVRVAAEQPLVFGVGHVVDPVPQRVPARPGEQLLSSRPYFSVITCQPAAVNMPRSRSAVISGTTRSRDWRFRSTTQTTSPSSATPGSTIASQTAPSSSSASPSSEYWRPAAR